MPTYLTSEKTYKPRHSCFNAVVHLFGVLSHTIVGLRTTQNNHDNFFKIPF